MVQHAGNNAKEMMTRIDYFGTITLLGSVRSIIVTARLMLTPSGRVDPQLPYIPQQLLQRTNSRN